MLILTALFDPSQPSPDGSFWSWHAPGLDRRLLDQLYYDVAAKGIPADPSRLTDQALIGGIVQLTPQWICVWRFANGGRDTHGRPGRFVMFTAFVKRNEADGVDLTPLLTCKVANDVLGQALTGRPVPAPAVLECDFHLELVHADPLVITKILREGRLELTGDVSFAQAGAICANLPEDRQWVCRLHKEPGKINAVFECPSPETRIELANARSPKRLKNAASQPVLFNPPPSVIRPQKWHASCGIIAAVVCAFIFTVALVPFTHQRFVQNRDVTESTPQGAPDKDVAPSPSGQLPTSMQPIRPPKTTPQGLSSNTNVSSKSSAAAKSIVEQGQQLPHRVDEDHPTLDPVYTESKWFLIFVVSVVFAFFAGFSIGVGISWVWVRRRHS